MPYAPRIVTPAVGSLLADLKARVGASAARATFFVWVAVVLGAGATARFGSSTARWVAAVCLVAVTMWSIVWPRWKRRRLEDEALALHELFARQPDFLAKVQRAFHLQTTPTADVSAELAALHYRRLLERAPKDAVPSRAETLRRKWNAIGVGALLCCAGLLARGGHWIAEGYNVLFARDGLAPWEMEWLEYASLEAKAPAYLGNSRTSLMWESAAGLPEGAVVSVRGRPLWPGVNLVLYGGEHEVPFVDDGDGALVAHWTLDSDVELRIAARFGDVLIREPDSVQIHSMPDQLPQVVLAGAPRELQLSELTQLELQWRAVDDHQVSQVDLVLRSGGKEERRTLDRPSPGMRQATGGHLVYPDDPFISQSFLPVVVRVEARDNNVERDREVWGRSDAFVLKPVNVGQAQAVRLEALLGLRSELIDILAQHRGVTTSKDAAGPQSAKEEREAKAALRDKLVQVRERARAVLAATYLGLPVARGLAAFVQGQFDTVVREVGRAGVSRDKQVAALEAAVLGLDAGIASMSHRDARDVSKSLGDVADEMAFAARQAQEGEESLEPARERLDLAISVLADGAQSLRRLGVLGADLGSVAVADLDRVQRSRAAGDYFHAELAALHLAGRLHRPNPSFGAKGGGGAVESGNGQQGGDTEGDGKASDADEAFDRLARDLAELAEQHAEAVDRTSNALDAADDEVRNDELAAEAKARAQALRRAVAGLPEPGEAPSTSRASAALSREHSGAMAHDLDNLDFDDAVESGRRARAAAEDAVRRSDLDEWTLRQVERAAVEIKQQLQWATEQRDAWQKLRERAAKDALSEVSKAEMELGERARRLASESGERAQLPEQARQKLSAAEELMRQAAQHLDSGRGQVGLNLQRQAQRLLEDSQPGQTTEPPSQKPGSTHGGRSSGFGGAVPAEDRRRQAEEFRRRVLEGLAKSEGGKLAPAVKRYAEGLLR